MTQDKGEQSQAVQLIYDLPPAGSESWVEFGGELRMKDIWEIADAEDTGDTRVLARKLPRIVQAWSLVNEDGTAVVSDDGETLDPRNPDHYAELTLSQYRALAEAAGEYIRTLADVGN